ncbi:TPA: hypothetical protein H1012_02775 [archaeon]|nr:hypothetical protein [Candidatus Naiadarchaeales archaeon SRR2090159.bin1288]
MKDGKPEVLIIGEWHPSSVYQYVNEEIKKEEIKTALSYSATSKVIIEGEIDAIKNFGAKKLLFEHPAIGGMVKICDELTGENNLLSFQKNLLKEFLQVFSEEQKTLFSLAKELGLEKEVGDGQPIFAKYTAKILTFIIGSTGVYDIGFFDDPRLHFLAVAIKVLTKISAIKMSESNNLKELESLGDKLLILDKKWKETNERREGEMCVNITKMLIDKTVVICGVVHAEAIKKGLSKIAFVHPLVRV